MRRVVCRIALAVVLGASAGAFAGIRSDAAFAFKALWTDRERGVLFIRSTNTLADVRADLSVSMRDFETGTTNLWTVSVPAASTNGLAEQTIDVNSLAPGMYRAYYRVVTSEGRVLTDDYAYFAKPDGKPVWEGTSYGAEDTVPRPWTTPIWRNDSFEVWNRTVRLGGEGLVSSVVSGGEEILAKPVLLTVRGRTPRFRVVNVEKKVSEADYTLMSDDGRTPVCVHVEFDGYMWFDLPTGADDGEPEVAVALKREFVEGFDDMMNVTNATVIVPGSRGDSDYDPFNFPFWWFGSVKAGMMGGTEGYRGRKSVSRYRFAWDDTHAEMRMQLTWSRGFYLEPTPMRPKNVSVAAIPSVSYESWTGHCEKFFEMKYPGCIVDEWIAPFREEVRKGTRVFYYNASDGVSPRGPWWAWFGTQWARKPDIDLVHAETPYSERFMLDRQRWYEACLSDRNFLDWKIWGACWFLDQKAFAVKDMYFDLADPGICTNPRHAHNSWTMRATREYHKRVCRTVQAKSPDGAMLGHLQKRRVPSDVFFDRYVGGEVLDRAVAAREGYYDVLTPELMRIKYASRSAEVSIDMLPQICRGLQLHRPDRLKSYDPSTPDADRAIRHAVAYFKIHGLSVRPVSTGKTDSWAKADRELSQFGAGTRHRAYYHADCPLSVDEPSDRFLYASYENGNRKMLIFLNDTDEPVRKVVKCASLSEGDILQDVYGGQAHELTDGILNVALPPRESLFLLLHL